MEEVRKKREILNLDELKFIEQMTLSLEQAEKKLEHTYKSKKPNQFNATKKFMLTLNKKISQMIKNG